MPETAGMPSARARMAAWAGGGPALGDDAGDPALVDERRLGGEDFRDDEDDGLLDLERRRLKARR